MVLGGCFFFFFALALNVWFLTFVDFLYLKIVFQVNQLLTVFKFCVTLFV